MRITHFILISTGVVLLGLPRLAAAGPKVTRAKTQAHASLRHTSNKRRSTLHVATHHLPTAVVMPMERATQIQTALIKQGYLTGEPTGTWDVQSISAMQKLQADNGWQSKVTPDARALIKLGLGPEPAVAGTETSNSVMPKQPQ
jgi:hypothetical protein